MSQMKGRRTAFQLWLVAMGLFWMALPPIHAQGAPGRITREDARSIVLATLQARGYDIKSPKLEVDEETDPYSPDFLHFGVSYDTPDRLARVGSFAVDLKTADLWDTGLCKRVKGKNVQRLQKIFRLRYRLPTPKTGAMPC